MHCVISANKRIMFLMSLDSVLLLSLRQNTEAKPVPLRDDEGEAYMLALKQEMRGTMQRLPHNIKPLAAKAGEDWGEGGESGQCIRSLRSFWEVLWHGKTEGFARR